MNLAVLMREAFIALNDLVIDRLTERGHADVRPAHGTVFQYLDDTGTTVSVLAERAQMTKQAMAELVRHLEKHGYVSESLTRPTHEPSWSRPPTAVNEVFADRPGAGAGDRGPSRRHRRCRRGARALRATSRPSAGSVSARSRPL